MKGSDDGGDDDDDEGDGDMKDYGGDDDDIEEAHCVDGDNVIIATHVTMPGKVTYVMMMKMKMVDSNDAIIVTYVTMTKKGPIWCNKGVS